MLQACKFKGRASSLIPNSTAGRQSEVVPWSAEVEGFGFVVDVAEVNLGLFHRRRDSS